MKLIRSIATPSCITLVFENPGKNSVVDIPSGDYRFPDMMEAVRSQDDAGVLEAFNRKPPVKFSSSAATMDDGTVIEDRKVVSRHD